MAPQIITLPVSFKTLNIKEVRLRDRREYAGILRYEKGGHVPYRIISAALSALLEPLITDLVMMLLAKLQTKNYSNSFWL